MQIEIQIRKAPLAGLFALSASCAALLLALCSPPARAAGCPNEAIRAEQGPAALALPDCRAFELVSPGSTPSLTSNNLPAGQVQASSLGDAFAYFSLYPEEAAASASEVWLASRAAGGWSVEPVQPGMTPAPTDRGICRPGSAFSEDLGTSLLAAGGDLASAEEPHVGECEGPAEELVAGEPDGFSNLYIRHGVGPYALLNPPPSGVLPANATFQAASPDLSHVVFGESAMLSLGSGPESDLFEWSEGVIRAIGVLPNGERVPAQLAAPSRPWGSTNATLPQKGLGQVSHAVSSDGERVFFSANGSLYLRENAAQPPAANSNCVTTSEPELACTLRLDISQGGEGENGGGVFQFASGDGERVFFLSDHKLTKGSAAKAGKPALYEYTVGTRKLVDLTKTATETVPDVRGFSGGSDDGSHLYFVARGVLTGGDENGQGEKAQTGEPNLYLAEEGSLSYVATLSPWASAGDGGIDNRVWWSPSTELGTAWSPSGRYLLFTSYKSLTGFDNSPAGPGLCLSTSTCNETYLYDAGTRNLSCLSCDPAGSKPIANSFLILGTGLSRFGFGPHYLQRMVLDSGRVFFQTKNPLSPLDVNGTDDVYSYHDGIPSLISSGTGLGGSAFLDASADGSDVFFATGEALVSSDLDGGRATVYDARIDGGFSEPAPPPVPCGSDEACRSSSSIPPPPVAPAATATFAGAGNPRPQPCKHGKVRRGNRCVKKAKRNRNHGHPGKSRQIGRNK